MKNKQRMYQTMLMAATTIALIGSHHANATEGGGSIYPNGAENYMVGAVPPPGVYVLEYLSGYNASQLRDNSGNQVPVNFNLNVTAAATRAIWVTDQTLLGGQLAFHLIAPLVNLGVSVNGSGQTKSGLGDITVGSALAYHASENLHYLFAVDMNAPTGEYRQGDMANLGRNYWNIEPLFSMTYVQASGFNADVKAMYDINGINKATNYRSGQELHADYALGWGFGNRLVAGVGGYVYQQVSDDTQAGNTVLSNRGRAFSIGPSVKYDNGKGWFITARYSKEFSVENRPEGSGFNVKMILPF